MASSEAVQFITVLRESVAAVRQAAQALRGVAQTTRRAGSSGMRPDLNAAAPERPPSALARIAAARPLPAAVAGTALAGDFARALQGLLRPLLGQLARGLGSSAGGGLLARLAGGGVGLLVSELLGRLGGRRLDAAATGPYELPALRSFPQLVLPGYASSPASALFGRRAVPRSPGLNVTVEYKRGADDFVVAKVTQRLGELNSAEGIY